MLGDNQSGAIQKLKRSEVQRSIHWLHSSASDILCDDHQSFLVARRLARRCRRPVQQRRHAELCVFVLHGIIVSSDFHGHD